MNMKCLLSFSTLSVALFLPASLAAQSEAQKDLTSKSDEELVHDLLNLFKDVSGGMQNLQEEMAKASLPTRSIEQQVAELEAYGAKLKDKSASDIPGGLREYFAEHPERLADVLGVSRDDALALLKDDTKMLEKLKGVDDKGIDPLLEDADALKDVVTRQHKIDEELQNALKRQVEIGRVASEDIDDTLAHAYEARDRFG